MNGKKILITGFSGFVARHFIEYVDSLGIKISVLGIDVNAPSVFENNMTEDGSSENILLDEVGLSNLREAYLSKNSKIDLVFQKVDMTDLEAVRSVVSGFTPDYVLHLAAFSSVAYSWKDPAGSFLNNSNIFLNLIEAIREYAPKCRVLSVGSSEEYGTVSEEDIPLIESREVSPNSPYAVARVSQEMLSKVFVDSLGLDIVLTRSFNHIGPRQDLRFVVPSFIDRILEIKRAFVKETKLDISENGRKSAASTEMGGAKEVSRDVDLPMGIIETGDASIIRDFVDVRDVVRAYYMLILNGRSGEIYNICSGRQVVLKDLINLIADKIGVSVETKINPEFVRPSDNMIIVGSNEKIRKEIGWEPTIDLDTTLSDMIEYMRLTNETNGD